MTKNWKDQGKIEMAGASTIWQSQTFTAWRGCHSMKRGNLLDSTAYSNEQLTSLSAPKLLESAVPYYELSHKWLLGFVMHVIIRKRTQDFLFQFFYVEFLLNLKNLVKPCQKWGRETNYRPHLAFKKA